MNNMNNRILVVAVMLALCFLVTGIIVLGRILWRMFQ